MKVRQHLRVAISCGLAICVQPSFAQEDVCSIPVANQVFCDDFNDGSVVDGDPVMWSDFPRWPLTMFEVVNGDLQLTPQLPNSVSLVAVPEVLGDTSIRAQVHLDNATSNQGVAVFARGNEAQGRSIALEIDGDGSLWLGIAADWRSIGTSLDPVGGDVILQLDVFGDEIKGWAWQAGESMPDIPQYSESTGGRLPTGLPGGYYGPAPLPQSSSGTAVYRYFQVATTSIPEPSSSLLCLTGVGLLAMRRQRRT